ncbi:hypothetical protein [Piscinibacter sp. XHJ-5]|uniref:hypothetical protein n=1 Tax=Piscinibacter sp. XHJ-5 TaxID=3037797 RepID=UPI0024532012|nr:hypothetical protein [Piscinibacter sp. XHJ-5]
MDSMKTTAACWSVALAMAGCGGGSTTTVGGTVSGLPAGSTVSLQNNGKSTLVVGANGSFTFDKEFIEGEHYDVTVSAQPAGGQCTVSDGKGRIDDTSQQVTNITVACVPAYSVSGSVSGLAENTSVTLQINEADPLVISANGFFVFPTQLVVGARYEVTVSTQPAEGSCTVQQGIGTMPGANVTNVAVTCE